MTENSVSNENEVKRGLEGVLAAETKIGYVNGIEGKLYYAGYEISTLAEQSNYEEVSYLLLHGELPQREQYEQYCGLLRKKAKVTDNVTRLIEDMGKKVHPMTTLRTAVSYLAVEDKKESESGYGDQKEMALNLIAKMPTIVAAIQRVRNDQKIIEPDMNLSYSNNFFKMSLGRGPDPIESKIMDTSLIVHADHGMNASTFSSLVTISTMSDMYSAITSAISTLKGPLHGGANERALNMLKSFETPEKVESKLREMTDKGERVMGFGHRVYKVYDPRAKILKRYAEYFGNRRTDNLFEVAKKTEELMINKYGERGIFPNVDFYSGIVYDSMGFSTDIFTPIFAVARISGWAARTLEYIQNNRLFRPKAKYTGEIGPLKYIPMQDRE